MMEIRENLEELKAKVDLVSFFEHQGVKFTKQHGDEYSGLCPFHNDKKPSFFVNRKKRVFKCFGCSAEGDIFEAVKLLMHCDFKKAVSYVSGFAGTGRCSPLVTEQRKEPVIQLVEEPVSNVTLDTAADHYHKQLYRIKEAVRYLDDRKLNDPAVLSMYGIGFCDGSLSELLSNGQREYFQNKGIIGAKGKEHFLKCITFPVTDERGAVVGMYGRSVDPNAKAPHLYLKGKHKSVFNRKASRVYKEIVLVESIIDCLSLVVMGIQNVQAIYGTNGFTDEHLAILKADRIKTVILGLDSDDAGREAATHLKEKLIKAGFEVKTIAPPGGKDWNDYLLLDGTAAEIKAIIEKAEVFRPEPGEEVVLEKYSGKYVFTFPSGETFDVIGFKEDALGSCKVVLKCSYYDRLHCDHIEMYSFRRREDFAKQMEYVLGIPQEKGTDRLLTILKRLEAIREERYKQGEKPQAEKSLTEEERKLGLSFLMNPNLFDELKKDLELTGCIGEDANKIMLYLAITSRIRKNPISIYILGRSGGGKSWLARSVLKLVPEDGKIIISSASNEVLYYMEDGLMHKAVMVGEFEGAEKIEYTLRELISESIISKLVTLKDAETGQFGPAHIKSKGPISLISTSTSPNLNPENLSRCIILHIDESPEQTKRILRYQRLSRSKKGYFMQFEAEKIIRKHHIVQQMLEDILIFNIFEDELDFPVIMLLFRRAHFNFLLAIEITAFVLQLQHEVKQLKAPDHKSKVVRYIETDLRDYTIAYNLMMEGIMENMLDELPKNAKDLHRIMLLMVNDKAKRTGKAKESIYLERRQVAEYSGWSAKQVRTYMNILLRYEYLEIVAGRHPGQRHKYRVLPVHSQIRELLNQIPTPEEMKKRLEAKKRAHE